MKRKIKLIVKQSFIATIAILTFSVFSFSQNKQDPGDLFSVANNLYQSEDFALAKVQYIQILEQGYLSPQLFLNLGNACYREGQLAESILFFEKGIKNYPNNKYINENLERVKKEVQTEIFEVSDFVLLRFWKAFSQGINTSYWAVLQIFFLLLIVVGIYLWLLKSERSDRKKGFILTLCSISLFIIVLAAGQTAYFSKQTNTSGIIKTDIQLKQGPDSRSNDITNLSEGVKVEIIDEISDWYKVSLLNKQEGWVSKSDLYSI